MSNNLWRAFKNLSDKSELTVAEVLSIGAETSELEDFHARKFVALGTGVAVGHKAFVKDGIIQGEAPSLPETEVFV
jgi:hypothetical protein